MPSENETVQGTEETSQATQETSQEVQTISEDIIKAHPLYRSLLAETIERRKKNTRYKQIIESYDSDDSNTDEQPANSQNKANTSDPIALVMQELNELKASIQQTTMQGQRQAILAKNNIPDEYQDLITGTDSATMQAQAEKLAVLIRKAPKPAPRDISDTGANNSPVETDVYKRVMAKIEGKETSNSNMNDPNQVKRMGGGVIRR